jgi:hypothetical protein
MSAEPELLSVVQQGFECWNTGKVDLMADMYALDAEIDFSAVFPDTGIISGEQDGLVVRNKLFPDTEAALAAASAAA